MDCRQWLRGHIAAAPRQGSPACGNTVDIQLQTCTVSSCRSFLQASSRARGCVLKMYDSCTRVGLSNSRSSLTAVTAGAALGTWPSLATSLTIGLMPSQSVQRRSLCTYELLAPETPSATVMNLGTSTPSSERLQGRE